MSVDGLVLASEGLFDHTSFRVGSSLTATGQNVHKSRQPTSLEGKQRQYRRERVARRREGAETRTAVLLFLLRNCFLRFNVEDSANKKWYP